MSRIVLVSNRVAVPRRGAASGGLAVGLMSAARANGGLWFGWSGEISDATDGSPEIVRKDEISYATIDLTQQEYSDFYLGFSNGVLWPIFHYFLETFHYSESQYEVYQAVNQRFARQLAPLLRPTDLVWVHDYHLIPLAQKLRAAGVANRIGFFLHIPFPQVEVLRALPVYEELLHALLEFDVIGVQTESDLRALRGAVEAIWGPEALGANGRITVGARRVHAAAFPIGVDVDGVIQEADESSGSEACRRMIAGLIGRRLMIGVDRLDYSKGLVERFNAYERFLETYPENRNRVTFLQIAPLSRSKVRAYSAIREELERATGRINGRFAETDWTPIRYLNRNFSHDVLMGFLRAANVGVVTPVRDGMNLVAKEFVAAQRAEDPGVLVLSTLAGAARELSSAVLVNPYDARGIAHALQAAFNMPLGERRDRHQAMLEILRRNDIHAWYAGFLQALAGAPAD